MPKPVTADSFGKLYNYMLCYSPTNQKKVTTIICNKTFTSTRTISIVHVF